MHHMDQKLLIPMLEDIDNFYRNSPYEHDQTATTGHSSMVLPSSIILSTPATFGKPTILPSLVQKATYQEGTIRIKPIAIS